MKSIRTTTQQHGLLGVLAAVLIGMGGAAPVLAAPGDFASRAAGNWNAQATWIKHLTGTSVAFVNASTNVTGTGTTFTTELAPGDVLMLQTTAGTVRGTVAAIFDDTHLSLTAGAAGTASGAYGKQQASPSSADGVITVSHAVNVTADVTVDQVVMSSASLGITNGVTFTVADGAGTDLFQNNSHITVHGTLTVDSGAVMTGGGGNGATNGSLNIADGGTLNLNGSMNGTGQSVSWALNVNAGGTVVQGNGSAISLSRGNGGVLVAVAGNHSVAEGATIEVTGAGSANVLSGGTLELAPTTFFGGTTFTLSSGGTLGVGSADGIATAGAVGNIRTSTRNFNVAANYEYNGTAAQITGNGLPAGLLGTLTINNASGVSLSRDTVISNALVLTSGKLITAATNRVFVAPAGTVSGASDASYVFGNLVKRFNAGPDQAFQFDIGDAAVYAPVNVLEADVGVAGNVTATTTAGDHPNLATSEINPARSVNRYWTMTPSGGLVLTGYNAIFNFAAGDVDAAATPAGFIVQRYNGANWTNATVGARTATSTEASESTSFSDFAIGESLFALPFVSIDDATVAEGDAGTTPATFTVALSFTSAVPVTVDYASTNVTAAAGSDYTEVAGTLTFDPGMISTTIVVDVAGDALDEADETFTITLSNENGANVVDGEGLGTITDDDPTPVLSVAPATATEGSGAPGEAIFVFALSAPSGRDVTVDYATSNGTAEAGSDYTAANGTATIPAGETNTSVTVVTEGDLLDEDDESFTLELSNLANATVEGASVPCTIEDDDATPGLSIGDVSTGEGDAGSGPLTLVVTLSAPTSFEVSVDYATSNVTAEAGVDYEAGSGTATIPAGATSTTVVFQVIGDTLDEANEYFEVALSNPVRATIDDGAANAFIDDDDAAPELSIGDTSVAEGDAGTVEATFTVTLAAVSGLEATANYATSNGTAEAGLDFEAATGSISIPAGQTSTTLTIQVSGDLLDEENETFSVELSTLVNATAGDTSGAATIEDNDPEPAVSIGDATVTEGDAGTTEATFTVSVSTASGRAVSVDYATSNVTAEAGLDYEAASGTVTVPAGATSTTLTVLVTGELLDEEDETFSVLLSNPVNAFVEDGAGKGTIEDDDTPPALSIGDASVTEGDAGTVEAVFTVTLSDVSSIDVDVEFNTSNLTAEAGVDYEVLAGAVTIPAGQTSTSITVVVNGDVLFEADETFTVTLHDANNATIDDGEGEGTITNDDAAPVTELDGTTVTEGDAGTTALAFTFSIDAVSGLDVSADYATSNGTAEAGLDYETATGTVTIPAGATETTIVVNVIGDTLDESDESFFLLLSNLANASFGFGEEQSSGTIEDDDAAPTISIDDRNVNEGNVDAEFTVSLSAASGLDVSVNYATSNGTAEAGLDYTEATGTVTIPAGATSTTLVVQVLSDDTDEPDETYTVVLSDPVNGTIADGDGAGQIEDEDNPPSVGINNLEVDEGGTQAVFTVSLSAASGFDVSVDYATSNEQAEAGLDYTAASGTVTIPAGATSTTLVVQVLDDALDEQVEHFTVQLSNAQNGSIDDGQGSGSILDDDAAPDVSIGDAEVSEGEAGTTEATLTVSLAAVSGLDVTVDYATTNGTAEAGLDYVSASGSVTIPAGATSTTLVVQVSGDTLDEADETFSVVLSNGGANGIDDGTGDVTITDDDDPPSVGFDDDISVEEGDSGSNVAELTVELSAVSSFDVTVDYASSNGTAVAGLDYETASGSVTIPAGATSTTVTFNVTGDTLDEANESFVVVLSNPSNATLGAASANVTITDDDASPDLTISEAAVLEGNAGVTGAVFTVTLSTVSGQQIGIAYGTTTNGTALAGVDYVATNGLLVIAAGETNATISVDVIGDLIDEVDETFELAVSNAENVVVLTEVTGATILDDDEAPTVSIGDIEVLEAATGTVEAVFTVSLSAASSFDVNVDYATTNETAEAGLDYEAASGTVTIPAGATSTSLTVNVLADDDTEENEDFSVTLSNPVNATLGDGQGRGTIVDNSDTDQDGLPNWWELLYFSSATNAVPSVDSDTDGLTNEQEYNLETDPTVADTDGDGVSDGTESLQGTDPLDDADFPARQVFDFDGDGKSDLGVFHTDEGDWYVRSSITTGLHNGAAFRWGRTARPFPGDYDGDGIADYAVYAEGDSKWYVRQSSTSNMLGGAAITWGTAGEIPVPADYDGDGKIDIATFKKSNGAWSIRQSTTGTIMGGGVILWGPTGQPVPEDYDGDAKTDLAVFAPSDGKWYVKLSTTGLMLGGGPITWGPTATPVPGDYDGDRKADLAVYAPVDGKWYVLKSSNNQILEGGPITWGASVTTPVQADYDGDGKTDLGVYAPALRKWYIRQSSTGTMLGGGVNAQGGVTWGHPVATPYPPFFQTLRIQGLAP